MDECDRADEQIAIDLAESLRRAALPRGPKRTPGLCGNCEATLPEQRAYCDDECRADHDRRYSSDLRAGRFAPPDLAEDDAAENTTHGCPSGVV